MIIDQANQRDKQEENTTLEDRGSAIHVDKLGLSCAKLRASLIFSGLEQILVNFD